MRLNKDTLIIEQAPIVQFLRYFDISQRFVWQSSK